jgi:drug/metabolite transporter (DMT)-like permease
VTGGAALGILLLLGFWFQTTGMEHTTPSRSAFITGTAVIFTPLLSLLLRIRRPSVTSVCGALLATVGLWLLTRPGDGGRGFGRGEFLTLLCAICFAGHILALDHYTRRGDKRKIAFLQVATVGVLAIVPAIFVEHLWLDRLRFHPTPRLFWAMAIMVLLATALALLVQSIVQSWTTPTRAAVIFALEPVFAALTAWIVDGEMLAGAALVGALLIFAGMIVAELRPPRAIASAE